MPRRAGDESDDAIDGGGGFDDAGDGGYNGNGPLDGDNNGGGGPSGRKDESLDVLWKMINEDRETKNDDTMSLLGDGEDGMTMDDTMSLLPDLGQEGLDEL